MTRTTVILALVALLVASVTLGATDAEAKKKNRIHVVRCADVGFECFGTERRDRLVGTPGPEFIFGNGGGDVYLANGGNTFLFDNSVTSNDAYKAVDPGAGQNTVITDAGGTADFLGMGSFRLFDDVKFLRLGDELVLEDSEIRRVRVTDHFGVGRMEKIRFANGTITSRQIEGLAREATPEERAALDEQRATLAERLDEEQLPAEGSAREGE